LKANLDIGNNGSKTMWLSMNDSGEVSEFLVAKISLRKPVALFGHWPCTKMNHSGLVLYLILHPEEIPILSGAKVIGLEINLPSGFWDDIYRGRRKGRIDLIFQKEDDTYLVEVLDKKNPSEKNVERVREYVRSLSRTWTMLRITPIIVCPSDSLQSVLLEKVRTE